MEINVRSIETLKAKNEIINESVTQLVEHMNLTQENLQFTERTLPLLVHMQLCEGLGSITINTQMQEAFRAFDKAKLREIVTYIKTSLGYPMKMQQFRKRVEGMGENCLKQNMGTACFKFGTEKDYWPTIPKGKLTDFSNSYKDIIEQETKWEVYNKNYNSQIEKTVKEQSLQHIEASLEKLKSLEEPIDTRKQNILPYNSGTQSRNNHMNSFNSAGGID